MDTHNVNSPYIAVKGGADFVTVAASRGPRLTKRWHRDADNVLREEQYEDAKTFDFATVPIAGLDDLAKVIAGIGPRQCLVLGKLRDGVDPNGARRRLHDHPDEPATIEDATHHWLPIDADSTEPCDERGTFDPLADPARAVACVVKRLPGGFAGADCLWQWTSGAGFKPGIRMRLFFWLDRPLTGAEMKAWLAPYREAVDLSIYSAAQPIYAAPPVCDGVADPIAQRTGIIRGVGSPWGAGSVTPPAVIVPPPKRTVSDPGAVAEGCQVDAEHVIDRGRDYLRGIVSKASPAEAASGYWGKEGNCSTYDIAARLGDFGASQARCVDLLVEELPGGCGEVERDWLEITVGNAFQYRQTAIGSGYKPDPFAGVEAPANANDVEQPAEWPRGHRATELKTMDHPPAKWAMHETIELGQPAIMPGDRGTGKTTFGLGLGVASGAGVPYLGAATAKMSMLATLGEDGYGRAEEMIAGLIRDLAVPESVRDGIHVISTLDDVVPGGPVLCRITADRNNPASVKVEQSRFMTECVVPQLKEMTSRGVSVLWLIDPLEHYVEFDRNMTFTARAVADRWLVPLCRQFGGLLTPFVLDHPSKAAMKDGQHYAGAPALVNPFPAFLSLRKKLDGNKPVVKEYQGIRQVSLEFETMRVKRAPERKIELYRIGDSPLLSTKPAEGLTLVSTMARVYAIIEEMRAKGQRVRIDSCSSSTSSPQDIAIALLIDERSVKDAMRALCRLGVYENKNAATGGKPPRDPGGLMPGALFDYMPMTPANLYRLMQERRVPLDMKPDAPDIMTRVDLEGEWPA